MQRWLAVCSLVIASAIASAQAPPGSTNATPAKVAPAGPADPLPSALVRPAADTLDRTISNLRFDRWKRGDIRDEASNNAASISKNIHHTLPGLLEAADQTPDCNAKQLALFQNIDAVYDVLLRIVSAARVIGTGDDVSRLNDTLAQLGEARRALANRMMSQAEAHEKLIAELRVSNQALLAAKNAPPPPVPCVPPPAKHHIRKRKPQTTKKPAQPAASQTSQKPKQ